MTKEEFIYILETRLPELSEIIETKPTKIKYKGTERTSGWSRQFIIPNGEAVGRYLQRIFGIDCPDWDLKYQQAVSGSGQEKDKITTLHSSSLLSLLCFSNVSKSNCLKINGIEYDQVWFEVKNKVFDKPSNIDVVLGNSKTQDLLFLESKFTEYLSANNSTFAAKYLDFYKSILPEIEKQPLQMVFPCKYKGSKGMGLQPSSKSETLKKFLYMDGIKQCFSHLIGLCQGPDNNSLFDWSDYKGKIRFGTILYRFGGKSFNTYNEFYSQTIAKIDAGKLAKAFKKSISLSDQYSQRIEILHNILTYQDVFKDFNLPEKVKIYYDL